MVAKTVFKTLGAAVTVALLAAAAFLVDLIWFRPFSLNLFYEKTFVTSVLENPELLTSMPSSSDIAGTTLTLTMSRSPKSTTTSRSGADISLT